MKLDMQSWQQIQRNNVGNQRSVGWRMVVGVFVCRSVLSLLTRLGIRVSTLKQAVKISNCTVLKLLIMF